MEREHRYFDGKTNKESKEQPDRIMIWNVRRGCVKGLNAECVNSSHRVVIEVQEQNSQQHQDRASQGVQEKFDSGVELARASADANKQIHGHQHGLPEHKEEEEVRGHEHAQHACLEDQK